MVDAVRRMLELDLPLIHDLREEGDCLRVLAVRFGSRDSLELVKPFAAIALKSVIQPSRALTL